MLFTYNLALNSARQYYNAPPTIGNNNNIKYQE
jgi:hypothetical protein